MSFGFNFVGFWCWRCVCGWNFVECVDCYGFRCVLCFVWLARKCGKREEIWVLNLGVLIIGDSIVGDTITWVVWGDFFLIFALRRKGKKRRKEMWIIWLDQALISSNWSGLWIAFYLCLELYNLLTPCQSCLFHSTYHILLLPPWNGVEEV